MRLLFSTIVFLLMLSTNLMGQQNSKLYPFKIDGIINADTGTVQLELLFDTDYHPTGVENITAKVENKQFSFNGNIPYPQGVTISYGDRYYSSLFVIDPGYQEVTCDIYSRREVPKVENASMKEYEEEYTRAFQAVRQKMDDNRARRDSLSHVYENKIPANIHLPLEQELKKYYVESDSALLAYVTTHPDSYIALWKFTYLFSAFGYESIFDSIYTQFSDSIRGTHTGRVLANKLEAASKLAYGKPFPLIAAVDIQNNKLDYESFAKNKYTFIDFWYSNCHPCIAQFPHLKETYEQYKEKGFEIIAISTDKLKYKQHWQKVIQKHQLLWPQYWDQDGIASSKLSINKFPTNFLLDSKGEIIKKDLRPVELEQFLKENLN